MRVRNGISHFHQRNYDVKARSSFSPGERNAISFPSTDHFCLIVVPIVPSSRISLLKRQLFWIEQAKMQPGGQNDPFLYLIAVALPPLAVALKPGSTGGDVGTCFFLTLLGWVPGVLRKFKVSLLLTQRLCDSLFYEARIACTRLSSISPISVFPGFSSTTGCLY